MKRIVVSAAVLVVLSFPCRVPAQLEGRRVLQGHVPPVVARLASVGRPPASEPLALAIGLPARNREALSNFLSEVYDPGSPTYRHYLTPEPFAARFGPTEEDYQAVTAFAWSNHLAVTRRHPNRLLLDVEGSVADIEKAFHVTLRLYPHPTERRTFYAPDVEPSVDAGLPVADISGLNNYVLPHPLIRKRMPIPALSNATPNAGSAGGAYRGKDFRAAYLPGVTLDGSGQAVGLLEFDGYYASDIATYESQAGLPSVPLATVLLDGFPGSAGANNVEVALDIEMAISMAPGLSQVIVYEAGPSGHPNDILNQMATDDIATQLSSSWTWGTTPSTTIGTIFQELAAQGQSFFQASGDSGAYTGAVNQPADNPYITVVGGTTLSTSGPGGSWTGETTWNWYTTGTGTGGSGGGISTFYAIPAWQQGISMTANQGSTVWRNIPDVAMTADNVYVDYDNGSAGVFGGTSCATPLWASFVALVNQQAESSGRPAIGFVNPTLYALARGANYSSLFHDITTGNNTNGSSPSRFFACPGYDLCTGWGTPAGQSLIDALAGPADALQIIPATGFTAVGPVGGPFNNAAQLLSVTNSGTGTLPWSLVNTSSWLNVSSGGGTLAAGATVGVKVTLGAAAADMPAGVFSADVVFSNMTSGVAQTRQFTVQVGQSLLQNGGFETGDFSDWTFSGSSSENSASASSFAVHSGVYGAALGQAGLPLATLSQTLSTVAGQPYLLSFWLDSTSPGGRHPQTTPNQFTATWNGSTLFNVTNIGVIGWTNVQFIVTAAANSTVLQFGFRDDPWYLGLDDISVAPVPVPALQPLLQANGRIALAWKGMTGLVYQVQYKTNLAQAAWVNFGAVVTATNSTVSASDSIGPNPQRFYRVVLLR
jgi:hypothetical protein